MEIVAIVFLFMTVLFSALCSLSPEPTVLANFKYKLKIIINSEVNLVAKAAKKKEKKGGKKK